MAHCNNCREEIQIEWKTCPFCSNPIDSLHQRVSVSDSIIMGDVSTTHNDPEAISRGFVKALKDIDEEKEKRREEQRLVKLEEERIKSEERIKKVKASKELEERRKSEPNLKLIKDVLDEINMLQVPNITRKEYTRLFDIAFGRFALICSSYTLFSLSNLNPRNTFYNTLNDYWLSDLQDAKVDGFAHQSCLDSETSRALDHLKQHIRIILSQISNKQKEDFRRQKKIAIIGWGIVIALIISGLLYPIWALN